MCIGCLKLWSRLRSSVAADDCPAVADSGHCILDVLICMFLKVMRVWRFNPVMGRFLDSFHFLLHDVFTFLLTAVVTFAGFVASLYILGNAGARRGRSHRGLHVEDHAGNSAGLTPRLRAQGVAALQRAGHVLELRRRRLDLEQIKRNGDYDIDNT